ncbi:MAG TPA: hypothetical protein VL354_06270 [Spirochaetia bacterium]|nr:hypothetical protein [Spirochaetia bacterium]
MEKMSFWRLIGEIERIVKARVPASHPGSWAEDSVIAGLVTSLASELNDTEVSGFRQGYTIRLSAFQHKGRREAPGSDISLLVHIARKDGATLDGAAFIEAKLKQDRKRTFESFRLPELKKLFRSSPFSHVLFLDYEDITSYSSNRSVQFPPMEYNPWRGGIPTTPCTYAALVPTNIVISQHLNDTSIYGFSVPLSYQLVYRYLHGLDLDLSEQALLAARGQPTKKSLSEFLLTFSIFEEGVQPVDVADLNRKVWGPVE